VSNATTNDQSCDILLVTATTPLADLAAALARLGHRLDQISAAGAGQQLDVRRYDLAVVSTGDALAALHNARPELAVLGIATAREALDELLAAGADDALVWPCSDVQLAARLRPHLHLAAARRRLVEQRDLVRALAHDLRVALFSIDGNAELVAGAAQGDLAPLQQEALASLRGAAERATWLVEDILDMARIDAGQMELNRSETRLEELADTTLRAFGGLAARSGLRLETCYEGPSQPVAADTRRLARVVGNLLSNALRYSPDGAAVRVIVRYEPEAALLGVCDQGPGVPPGERDRIFDRYVRLGLGGSTGLGLGLSICREIVTRHGGAIWVEGEPGEGATFWVRLPLTTT
jgi:signal transduction histidine kinase